MTSKKIFITIPWFLPAFRAGGPIRSVANLVNEVREGIEYYIFCGDTDLNGSALDNVQTDQWLNYNEQVKVWYCSPEKISDTLVKQVEKVRPDVLFIIGVFSWHFNMVPLMFCKGPKKILSARGMLLPGALSQKKWKKKVFLQLFKLLEFHHKVYFHATDEEEQKYITNCFGEPAKVFVAGNFPSKCESLPMPAKEQGVLKLLTIALISPMKNILLVLEALEKVSDRVQYDIYGPVKDEEYWHLCREKIKQLPENISATFHQEVSPACVPEILSASHVFILPSKSENFGHAIYEALSAGRPVITSHHTPWNQLQESRAGMNVSTDYALELTDAIEFFAGMDRDTLDAWSSGAVAYAEGAVDVCKIKNQYVEMFGL